MIDRSKLQVPAFPRAMVLRTRTDSLLDAAITSQPVTVLHAPAGYGKTTAVLGWLQSRPEPVAWLTIDAFDNDPQRLAKHLFTTLDEALPGLAASALHALEGGSDLIATCTRLLTGQASSGLGPALLILDDCQALTEPDAQALARACVEALAASDIRTVITSRTLAVPGANAQPFAAIGPGELAFSAVETRALVNQGYALDLSDRELSEFIGRAHGWPVGLSLMAASVAIARASGDPSRSLPHLGAGSRAALADYVVQEILDQVPPRLRNFLLRCAVLDRLTGPLCCEVLHDPAAEQTLHDVVRSIPTVIDVSSSGQEWIHVHGLVRDTFMDVLEDTDPDAIPILHARAARWLTGQQLHEDAVNQAIAAADPALTAETIAAAAQTFLQARQYPTLRRALESATADLQYPDPFCEALDIVLSVLAEGADQLIARRRAAVLAARHPRREDIQQLTDRVLMNPFAGDVAAAVAAGRSALERHRGGPHPEVSTQLAFALLFNGEPGQAAALVQPLVLGNEPTAAAIHARTVAGMVAALDGELERGELLLTEAARLVYDAGAETAPDFVATFGGLGAVLTAAGKLDKARLYVDRYAAARELERPGSMGHGIAMILDARLALAERRRARARSSLARAHAILGQLPDIGPLTAGWLSELDASVLRSSQDTLTGTLPTPAELRVLDLLAQGLSRAQIADRLYLSEATVKSHLRRLFKRLDVASRDQAISVARRRGLVRDASAPASSAP